MLIEKCYRKEDFFHEISFLIEINNCSLNQQEKKALNECLDRVFNNTYFCNDIERIILAVRTVLKNHNIKTNNYNLMVDLVTEYEKTTVEFNKNKLTGYCKSLDSMGIFYNIYLLENGNLKTNFKLPIGYSAEKASQLVAWIQENEAQTVRKLRKSKTNSLSITDIALIETYQLFYGEIPDFTQKDVCFKANSMLYILSESGLVVAPTKCEMPYRIIPTPEVKIWFNSLKPFAGIYNYDKNDSQLTDEISANIIKIGREINETIKEYYWLDEISLLTHFCELIEEQKNSLTDREVAEKLVRELDKK